MSQQVQLPDGTVAEFPDGMDDNAIKDVIKRKFLGPEAQGQAQMAGLMKSPSTGFSGVQSNQELRQQVASDLGKEDPSSPAFYGGGPEGAQRAGEFSGTAEAAPVVAGIIGSGMAGGAVLPFAPKVVGAGFGGYEGYKRGGVGGAALGALAGAARPGATGAVSGALEGYDTAGLPGAVIGGVLGSGRGVQAVKSAVGLMKGGKAAATAIPAIEDTIQAVMKAGNTDRATAEAIAAAIEQQAGRGAKAATKAVDVAGDVAKATRAAEINKAVPATKLSGGTAGEWAPEEVAANIGKWRQGGFSEGQMLSSLSNVYGIPRTVGKKLLEMF